MIPLTNIQTIRLIVFLRHSPPLDDKFAFHIHQKIRERFSYRIATWRLWVDNIWDDQRNLHTKYMAGRICHSAPTLPRCHQRNAILVHQMNIHLLWMACQHPLCHSPGIQFRWVAGTSIQRVE